MADESNQPVDATVKIGSDQIPPSELHDVIVESDLGQPDHAVVTLSNESTKWSEKVTEGDDMEIKLGLGGIPADTVFKGEITGIEPIYDTKSKVRVNIRALNCMSLLARGKKSVAYLKVTDKDIVDKICQQYSLTAKYGDSPPTTKYEHVYQHNQTDLEFVRIRAARIGFEVLVNDKELYFRKRTDAESGITLEYGVNQDGALEKFMPRLSTANQVSEVRVRGWNPDKKEEIVGIAKPASSKLGDKTGSDVANTKHSNVLAIDVDAPVATKEEADNIAKSILQERLMSFIVGEGICRGRPDLKPGIIVKVNCQDKRFNGNYYIIAVKHVYMHDGANHGYRVWFKFRRDAESNAS
jgi:phage protein D